MDIEFFKSQFSDFLRPNRYRVFFRTFVDESISAICKNVTFPFYTFNTLTGTINNKSNTVINKIDYDPVSFTFYIDKEKRILKFINKWKERIIDEYYRFGYKDDYKIDIDIEMLHLDDEVVASCTLKEAFLINVDPIDLSYDSKDVLSEITISVNYDDIKYNI